MIVALVLALLGSWTAESWAQPAPGEDEAEEARLEKARAITAQKRATLERLAGEFPDVRWLLVGDDGQHDPEIYGDFVASHPENVAAVAIRQLSPTQSVLAGGLPATADGSASTDRHGRPWMSAPDGAGLARQLSEAGLL